MEGIQNTTENPDPYTCAEKRLWYGVIHYAFTDLVEERFTNYSKEAALEYFFFEKQAELCNLQWIAELVSENPDGFVDTVRKNLRRTIRRKKFTKKVMEKVYACMSEN